MLAVWPSTSIRSGGSTMAYVIAEPCIDNSDQSCVAVCPVDCITADPRSTASSTSTRTAASTAAPARLRARIRRSSAPTSSRRRGPTSPGSTRPGTSTQRRLVRRSSAAPPPPDGGDDRGGSARVDHSPDGRRWQVGPARCGAERDADVPDRPDRDRRPVHAPAGRRRTPVRGWPVLRAWPRARWPAGPAAVLDGNGGRVGS